MTKLPTIPTSIPNATTAMRQLGDRASHGNGPSFGPAEPVCWGLVGENKRHGNNTRRINGRVERLPPIAHTGESDYLTREVHPRAHTRYAPIVDGQGNLCNIVFSNAAGHIPVIVEGKWSSDGYAMHVLRKGLALGWINTRHGCLCRQVKDGLVNPRRLLVDLSKAKVCAKDAATCKHIEAEQTARQDKQRAAMQKLEDATAVKDPSIAIGIAVAKALAAHEASKGGK